MEGVPKYAPGTIAVNITWMERGFTGRIAVLTVKPTFRALNVHKINIQESSLE